VLLDNAPDFLNCSHFSGRGRGHQLHPPRT
jgi:hypothetical protein